MYQIIISLGIAGIVAYARSEYDKYYVINNDLNSDFFDDFYVVNHAVHYDF
jgi:hypothetical protein